MQPDNKHVFNDDLLANEGDLGKVHELYRTLEHALYHQELVDYFNEFNHRADAAKAKSRKWGTWAIGLGAAALVLAAAEIVADLEIVADFKSAGGWSLAIGGCAAICGLFSVAVGGFGVLFGSRKREWLHNRFMGERIRQFHFQSLIMRLPQITAPASVGADEGQFESDRQQLFLEFKRKFDGHVDSQFNSVIGPFGEQDWQLIKRDDIPIKKSPEMDDFCKAYCDLRILHQLGYANYKLGGDHKIFSAMPRRQADILENVSKGGFAWLFVIHAVALMIVLLTIGTALYLRNSGAVGEAAHAVTIVFSLAIIVIAIVGLSVRAFQEGLQPEREIERYQQYRSAVQLIREQFDEADTPSKKIDVMWQMEHVAFEEMRNFLITNDRSSFAM